MTEKILENLRMAYDIISDTPESSIDMQQFTSEGSCGTLHCAVGWLATTPYFQALGLYLVFGRLRVEGQSSGYAKLDSLLGLHAFDRLFNEYGDGDRDEEIPEISEFWDRHEISAANILDFVDDNFVSLPLTHKGLALARIEMQIAAVEAPV